MFVRKLIAYLVSLCKALPSNHGGTIPWLICITHGECNKRAAITLNIVFAALFQRPDIAFREFLISCFSTLSSKSRTSVEDCRVVREELAEGLCKASGLEFGEGLLGSERNWRIG